MTHRCSHCDLSFEHEPKKSDVVRCPKCLRTQGLEKLGADKSADQQRSSARSSVEPGKPEDTSGWRPNNLVIGVFIAAAAAGVWFYFSGPNVEDLPAQVPMRALQAEEVSEYLRRESVEANVAQFLEAPASFASDASANAVQSYVAERGKAGAFVSWARVRATGEDVRTPEQVSQVLAKTDKARLYPLEVAWATVVWLRDQGQTAMLAEIIAREAERAPPDPSGRLGYYGVALGTAEDSDVVDVFGNGKVKASRLLNDVQAVAALRALQAMTAFEKGDAQKASRLAQDALDLDGKSPVVRSAYAETLLSGVAQDAIKEIEHAHSLRPDAPRRLARAKVALAQGQLDEADKVVASLVSEFPDYASAHAMLSVVHLARHELDEAEAKLKKTAALAPDFPELDLFRAELSAARGDLGGAANYARKAIEDPHVRWQTRLRAAMLLRAAGDYDEMRRQAHAIMASVPEAQRMIIRAQIEQLLGPTALENPDELALDDEVGGTIGGTDDMQLQGSSLLGADDGLDVSLLDDELGSELQLDLGQSGSGGLQLGGGGSGSGPKLELE